MSLSREQIAKLHRRAERALLAGQPRQAHQLCQEILAVDRRHADAWFICGVIAGQNRQFQQAVKILRNATTLAPGRADYLAELGKYLIATDSNREANEAARRALELAPTGSPTLHTLGTVFSHCGEHEQAIACFDGAIAALRDASAESNAELHFNRGVSLQFAGRLDDAGQAFEAAISLRPEYFKAHSALSTVRRQTPDANHLSRLRQLRERAITAEDKLRLGHAIAREQEDLGNYHEAMRSLNWAKADRAREAAYDSSGERRLFRHIASTFSAERLRQLPAGFASTEPIFIVGMPRTGTTLAEQILGSHSAIFAAGELQAFAQQVRRLAAVSTEDVLDIETVDAAAGIDTAQLGRHYIEATRPLTGHSAHFVDKLPRNFLYLGLIHKALPEAKIICLRRDPMDTCLSNYRQLFAINNRHYHYNLTLEDCGRYFIQFDALMRHWRETMPGVVYELSYEALVREPEAEVRKLLGYCALPWEDACLEFHTRDNAVATPSAVQVKQGIYSSAVERWRKYGDAMQPLYEMLREAGFYP